MAGSEMVVKGRGWRKCDGVGGKEGGTVAVKEREWRKCDGVGGK